jgi:hypothetical protein
MERTEMDEKLFDMYIICIFLLFANTHVQNLFSQLFIVMVLAVSECGQEGAAVDIILERFGEGIFLQPAG